MNKTPYHSPTIDILDYVTEIGNGAHSAKSRIRRRACVCTFVKHLKHTQNSTTAKLPSPQSVEYPGERRLSSHKEGEKVAEVEGMLE